MENTKPVIFFLTSRFPYPLEKGDKLRSYHQIKNLSKTYKIVLCSLTFGNIKNEWLNELNPYCHKIHIIKLSKFKAYFNLLLSLFLNRPFQVGYFFQKAAKSKVDKILFDEKIDFIYCQLIRCSEYVKNIHNKHKTIDYMDALSKGMFRRAEKNTGLKRLVFNIEGRQLKIYENKIFDYFDQHAIISEQDQSFISHPLNKTIKIVENGIDNSFVEFDSNQIEKKFDIVFVGNLSYAPNIEACIYIVDVLLPYFNQKGTEIKVLLSGANPSKRVKMLGLNKNVKISGWVKDIKESYCQGKVFVAPLFIGTGLQNKLLEAMALGVPCITTSLANKALKATHNENVLIANEPEEFYQNFQSLNTDSLFLEKVRKKAKSFVVNKYSWQKSVEKIEFK